MAARADLRLEQPLRELLAELSGFFADAGVEAYAVGGFLRDALVSRPVHDVDISISGDPIHLGPRLAERLGGHYFPLAEEERQARVVLPQRDLHLDLLPLRGDIQSDLKGRDYTIDAMATRLDEAAAGRPLVIDPAGGRQDLRRRLVRVTQEEAFQEDPLRPLRGARLATELDFRIEAATAALVRRYATGVRRAAPERQRDELMRILGTDRAGRGVRLLDELGLLQAVLPEVAAAAGVEQPKEHHWDVLGHSLETVRCLDALLAEDEPPADSPYGGLRRELRRQLAWWREAGEYLGEQVARRTPRRAVLKLAGLLHDIAKPETKTFDGTGRMRFFGHADAGAAKAASLLRRLHFSGREVALVQAMVKAHLRPVQMGQQGPPTRRALYRYFRDVGEAAVDTLFLSLADHLATVGPRVSPSGWRQHVSLVNYILEKRFQEDAVVSPPRLLRGDELMAELGLPPGPQVGRLLESIREARAAGDITTREEALELARSLLEGERVGAGKLDERSE